MRYETPQTRTARGFTMLEVILAAVIFAIVGLIVLTTFRTGTRAYERVERRARLLDQGRAVFEAIEGDVHDLYFLDESQYNINIRGRIDQWVADRAKAELEDDWETFINCYGDPDEKAAAARGSQSGSGSEEKPGEGRQTGGRPCGNPFESGILIDLQFVSEAKGIGQNLTFVRYSPVKPDRPSGEWGLERVRYEANDGVLLRTTESIVDPIRDAMGVEVEGPPEPKREILATGVTQFQLRFGYWFDEVWIETDHWNSSLRDMRNSFNVRTPDPDSDREEQRRDPESPEYQRQQDLINSRPADGLPAYMRILVEIEDQETGKFRQRFNTVVRFPASQETFIPNPTLDDDRRDAEIDSRLAGTDRSGS